jgi:hypothetical protein
LPQGSASQFNRRLDEISQRKLTLLTLPEPTSACPLQMLSVDDADFSALQENGGLSLELCQHNGIKCPHGTITLAAVELLRTTVSCWDVNEGTMPRVPFEFACQVHETVGDGCADRSCARRVGTNVCFGGARCSFRPRPSPDSGKGRTIFESSCHRESCKLPQTQSIIEACVKALGEVRQST